MRQYLCQHSDDILLTYKLHSWIFSCLRKADKDKDDKLSQSEMKNFLQLINIELDDDYAEMLFQVKISYRWPPKLK